MQNSPGYRGGGLLRGIARIIVVALNAALIHRAVLRGAERQRRSSRPQLRK